MTIFAKMSLTKVVNLQEQNCLKLKVTKNLNHCFFFLNTPDSRQSLQSPNARDNMVTVG